MKNNGIIKFSGFTPILDSIIDDLGQSAALVYGMIWRYCQMETGTCFASQDKIAERCGLARTTINILIGKLVEFEYLKDKTPELKGVPHTYSITGKAEFKVIPDEIDNLSENQTGGVLNSDNHLSENQTHKIPLKDILKDVSGEEKLVQDHKELLEYFCEITKHKPPKQGAVGISYEWWEPIGDMLVEVDMDISKAKEILRLSAFRADERNFSFASPKGLLKTFKSISAEQRRGVKDKPDKKDSFREAIQRAKEKLENEQRSSN